jgi:hypothetical protein
MSQANSIADAMSLDLRLWIQHKVAPSEQMGAAALAVPGLTCTPNCSPRSNEKDVTPPFGKPAKGKYSSLGMNPAHNDPQIPATKLDDTARQGSSTLAISIACTLMMNKPALLIPAYHIHAFMNLHKEFTALILHVGGCIMWKQAVFNLFLCFEFQGVMKSTFRNGDHPCRQA